MPPALEVPPKNLVMPDAVSRVIQETQRQVAGLLPRGNKSCHHCLESGVRIVALASIYGGDMRYFCLHCGHEVSNQIFG
jgi:hypothetical protein